MLRLALIGGSQQAEAFQRLQSRLRGAQIRAVVENDANESGRMAKSLGADVWFTTIEELLAEQSATVDACIVAPTAKSSEDDCRLSIAAGKHVFLQSSALLAFDVLKDISSAAEQAKLRFMWGSPLCFLPFVKTMKESLAKAQLGELGLLRMHCWDSVPSRDVASNLLSELNLVCWLFDRPPSLVYANSRKSEVPAAEPSQDYIQIHLGFPAGGMALIDHAVLNPPRDDYFSLSLIGSNGAAYADDNRNMQLLYRQGHPAALKTGQGNLALLAQLQEFINSAVEKREPLPGVIELRHAIDVHTAVTESIATGRAVPLRPTAQDD